MEKGGQGPPFSAQQSASSVPGVYRRGEDPSETVKVRRETVCGGRMARLRAGLGPAPTEKPDGRRCRGGSQTRPPMRFPCLERPPGAPDRKGPPPSGGGPWDYGRGLVAGVHSAAADIVKIAPVGEVKVAIFLDAGIFAFFFVLVHGKHNAVT